MDIKYDLEVVLHVSSKYPERIDHFKKCGLVNKKQKKVLLTVLTSDSSADELREGWDDDLEVHVIRKENHYAQNVYEYLLNMTPQSRWIMKLDDDSCTDVHGLIDNLDLFYDSDEKYYLACSSTKMHPNSPEFVFHPLYKNFFGEMFVNMQHEIEACVVSRVGMEHVLSNKKSRQFLEERIKLQGGATDVALAFASSLSKLYPTDLIFAHHLPLINKFSIFGGHLNHIHLVSKNRSGENFPDWERCGDVQYEILTRRIRGALSESEKFVSGKKFLSETNNELRLIKFNENGSLKIKFDHENYVWGEHNEKIVVFCHHSILHFEFELTDSGFLTTNLNGEEITYRPVP